VNRRTAWAIAATLLLSLLVPLPSPASNAGPFPYRGVIFGPYGRVWTHEDRMSILAWMGRRWRDTGRPRMNIYIQAAKNDVYQRLRWRVPYPANQMADFRREIAFARSLGVEWVPSISPALPLIPSTAVPNGTPSRDICFSCPADLRVLLTKLRPFAAAGVRTFMVGFDDTQKRSTHLEDALAYGTDDAAYGSMNADLLNRVHRALQAEHPASPVTLITVPADYSGTKRTDYLTAFGKKLDPQIKVMWTGTAVVSPRILAKDAVRYSAAISTPASGPRRLLVWDNFPVNDYNGNIASSTGLPTNFKLNVGPYKGRRDDLPTVIDGILANPMNEAEASKIPLYGVAAYLNDPGAYTSRPARCANDHTVAGCLAEADWLEGIREFGGSLAGTMFSFVDQMRSTPMDRTESPVFRARWEALRAALAGPFWPEARDALVTELRAEAAAAPTLRARFRDSGFLVESRNHLALLERSASVGLRATQLLAGLRPGLDARIAAVTNGSVTVRGHVSHADPVAAAALLAGFVPLEATMRTSPYSVYGDRFQTTINTVYVLQNQMDAFANYAHRAFIAWLPSAPRAATGPISVRVNGVAIAVDGSGNFAVTLATGGETVRVVATDAAGFQTGALLSAG
jgi:hyaluronoglucosaminidase